jgi:hypothetical protein
MVRVRRFTDVRLRLDKHRDAKMKGSYPRQMREIDIWIGKAE